MGKRSRNSTRRVPAELAKVVSGMLRALSLCPAIAAMDVPVALAQIAAPEGLVADIPAQPLGDALAVFAKQTGLQLVYVSGVVDGQRSRAVRAGLMPEAALSRLLQGTGLKFEYLRRAASASSLRWSRCRGSLQQRLHPEMNCKR